MKEYNNNLDFPLNLPIYFIHIPKTSGQALRCRQIRKQLHKFNVPNVYRTPANEGYFRYTTKYWGMYNYYIKPNYKISIIRNPFDLLTSYYFHHENLRKKKHCPTGWGCVNNIHNFKSFKEFITAYCDPDFEWHIPAFKNFLYSQLFDTNHNCVADIIIKYEYRDEAFDILNKKLEYPIRKYKKNVSRHKTKKYTEYYDEETIELVYKKCERELKYFNYDFNGSIKHEPLIINCNLKYDVYNNKICI